LAVVVMVGYSNDTLIKMDNDLIISYQIIDSARYDAEKIPRGAAEEAYSKGFSSYFDSSLTFNDPFGFGIKIARTEVITERVGHKIIPKLERKELAPSWKFNPHFIVGLIILLIVSFGFGFFLNLLGFKKHLYFCVLPAFSIIFGCVYYVCLTGNDRSMKHLVHGNWFPIWASYSFATFFLPIIFSLFHHWRFKKSDWVGEKKVK